MSEPLGLSVYLSTFEQQRATLKKLRGEAVPIFLSLHISEEFGEGYCQKAEMTCRWLTENGFRIIADVSPKAAACFGQDVSQLADHLGVWALRLDYGFSTEEICRLAKKLPLVLNASTVSDEVVCQVLRCDQHVMAIQAQILNLLMDLQDQQGLSYMFITHDLCVVKHISDEIMVMYMGQTVEYAKTEEIFANPLHPYTKALLQSVPTIDLSRRNRERYTLKGEVSNPIDPAPGCRFAPRCQYACEKCKGECGLREVTPGHLVACAMCG